MMNEKELMERLNEICLEEFKANYNKGECVRILNYYNPLAKALEDELQAELPEGFKIKVSNEGTLQLLKYVGNDIWSVIKTVVPRLMYKLPYAYVMGRPISKTAMLKVVASI